MRNPEPLRSLLPALRRYARAATGHAAAGEAVLEAALPGIIAACDPDAAAAEDTRPLRWRALAALIVALGRARVVPLPVGGTLGDVVASLPPQQRHSLLLTSLEELSHEAAGTILGMPPAEVAQQAAAARAALRSLAPARVMIIEDEPLIADDLAAVVEALGHAVCATAAEEAEACRAAREHRPELLLADLRLGGGGSGLSAARRIAADAPAGVGVVFVTGHPELLAEERDVVVVRKPYQETALRAAIGRALASRPHVRAH